MKNNPTLLHFAGNALIILSLFGLFYTYYPLIILLLPHKSVNIAIQKQGFYIEIPKIKAQAQIIEHVDPWNKTSYENALKKGVAHAKGTFLPGDKKTIFLFAHSSAAPWEMTRNNTVFMFLGNLKKSDEIFLYKNGVKYEYKVYETKTVWPSETEFLNDLITNQLILQTCTPFGTDFQRLLVFARQVN